MQLTAPCSVQLLLHCHPDAPPDPSWLQAVSSQMPTAGHFSALEAPQLALDTQRLLTTPLRPHSYRYVQTPATSPLPHYHPSLSHNHPVPNSGHRLCPLQSLLNTAVQGALINVFPLLKTLSRLHFILRGAYSLHWPQGPAKSDSGTSAPCTPRLPPCILL